VDREALQLRRRALSLTDAICEPKPVSSPRPTIYAGGESEAAKTMIATQCDAYVMHGDPVEAIRPKIEDMERGARRPAARRRCNMGWPPIAIVRDSEAEAKRSWSGSPRFRRSRPRASTISTSGCRARSWSAS
jgi:alkanesulfonate monooxygenase SsuD/methylene tetrahydromethanopterin reductase-like flavin-dependent oxidoreductase (luciferase family)